MVKNVVRLTILHFSFFGKSNTCMPSCAPVIIKYVLTATHNETSKKCNGMTGDCWLLGWKLKR